jgi:hypothetical protein
VLKALNVHPAATKTIPLATAIFAALAAMLAGIFIGKAL